MSPGVEDTHLLMADVVEVRQWRPEPVSEADLERLLLAFGLGPSSGQPWEVLRLEDEATRQAAAGATLDSLMAPGSEGAQRWLAGAPVVLLVCVELRRAMARMGERGRIVALQDVGAALQNLRLAAGALGLRTGTVRDFQPERMGAALGLPWFLEPAAIVALGHSDAELVSPPRFSLADFCRVHERPAGRTEAEGKPPLPPPAPVKGAGGALSVMYRRRSIRRFTGEPLQAGVREQLLAAATQAPTAGDMQPWEFILLEDPEARKAAIETTFTTHGAEKHQVWFAKASLLVAVCVNRRRTTSRFGERLGDFAFVDVALAVENLVLAATELGLGSCCIGGFWPDQLSRVLGLPAGVEVLNLVAIGPAAQSPAPPHRMPLGLVTHRDRWGTPFYGGAEPVARESASEPSAAQPLSANSAALPADR